MQMEREKQIYDFENLQSQLDKALGQSTRMQKERETIQLEVDRLQDKYEKAQVNIINLFIINLLLTKIKSAINYNLTHDCSSDHNATTTKRTG